MQTQARISATLIVAGAIAVFGAGCGIGIVPVTVTPLHPTVLVGGTVTFTATVGGAPLPDAVWSILEGGGGTIDANGLYTAPSSPGVFHVIATSGADVMKTGIALVSVTTSIQTGGLVISSPLFTVRTGFSLASKKPQWQVSGLE